VGSNRDPNHMDGGYPMLVEVQQRLGGMDAMQSVTVSHRGLYSRVGSRKWVVGVVVGCGVELRTCWVQGRHGQE